MKKFLSILIFLLLTSTIFGIKKDEKILFNGKKAYESGDYEKAILNLSKFLDLHKNFKKTLINYSPRVERAYALRGNAFFKEGNFKKAISDYKNSLKINDTQSIVWHNLGISYLKINNLKDAINSLKKAISINKQQEKSYYYLGICYEKSDDLKMAEKKFKKLISIDEINGNGYIKLIDLNLKKNNIDEARELLLTSLGKKEKPVSIFKLEDSIFDIYIYGYYKTLPLILQIMEYLRVNNFKKAEKLCKKELKKNGQNEEVLVSLGIIYFTEKKDNEALSTFRKALKLNGNDILLLNYMGLLLLRDGKGEDARNYFEKANETKENLISKVMLNYLEKVK